MQAKHVMTSPVITVSVDATVAEIAELSTIQSARREPG